jgi:DNA polymerase I-like protein with 3'-5' exonuclease and polymerase domains
MRDLFLDFETYYDKAFSLRKMTTVEYIKDQRFAIHGFSAAYGDDEVRWYEGVEADAFLASVDWADTNLVCHNTAFDGAILSFIYGYTPCLYSDTMSMANYFWEGRANLDVVARRLGFGAKTDGLADTLGLKVGTLPPHIKTKFIEYANNDVTLTRRIYQALIKYLPYREQRMIDVTIRMYTQPSLLVNADDMDAYAEGLADALFEQREHTIAALVAENQTVGEKTFSSNKQFAALLEALGVEVPTKLRKPTKNEVDKKGYDKDTMVEVLALGKGDENFLALLEHEDLIVRTVVEQRIAEKSRINETRAKRFATISRLMGGKLPVPLRYMASHTGRWGGRDSINLQNLPSRGKDKTLRKALLAPPGYRLVVADLSQIEPRVLAWLAGEYELLEAFAEGKDIYTTMHNKVFGSDYDAMYNGYKDNDPYWVTQRNIAKACIAEGQLVLTHKGLVPIDKVNTEHLLWDGVEWVSHEGVIYKGERGVITYDGLTATPDHIVFTADGREIPFGQAASEMVRVEQTGVGRTAIRVNRDYLARGSEDEWLSNGNGEVPHIRNTASDNVGQSSRREDDDVLSQRTNTDTERRGIRSEVRRDHSEMQQGDTSALRRLRSAWDSLRVRVSDAVRSLLPRAFTSPRLQGSGDRQDRQQWELRHRESTAVNTAREYAQQKKLGINCSERTDCSRPRPTTGVPAAEDGAAGCGRAIFSADSGACYTGCTMETQELDGHKRTARVYDIVNAGPRNRFTVEGKLVHNCVLGLGYGMGHTKFRVFLKNAAKQSFTEDEAKELVTAYRRGVSGITALWKAGSDMVEVMSNYGYWESHRMVINKTQLVMPSNNWMDYPGLKQYRIRDYKTGQVKTEYRWGQYGENYIYGALVIENIVQALSRDIMADMTARIYDEVLESDERIANLVHDEVVCVIREDRVERAKELVREIMSTAPSYCPGLPVNCSIDDAMSYGDAK